MSEKQKQAWSVAFAVFCGGFCGMVLGQYLAEQLPFIWGGLLAWTACVVIGGIVGYISVDPWDLISKIPSAGKAVWKDARELFTPSLSTKRLCAFCLRNKGTMTLLCLSNLSWFAVGIFAMVYGIYSMIPLSIGNLVFAIATLSWYFHFLSVCSGIWGIESPLNRNDLWRANELLGVMRNELFLIGNSVVLPLFVIYLLLEKFWCVVSFVPKLIGLVVSFFWNLYCLTHTNARLIAMVDAALFAGVAFFAHSIALALLISVIGAIWGVVNYLFIAPILVPRVELMFAREV